MILSELGFEIDVRGRDWYFKDQRGLRNLTRLAYENYNMFSNPIFLHSKPIVKVNNPDKSTKVEETLGTIELENTFLPENVADQVRLSVFKSTEKYIENEVEEVKAKDHQRFFSVQLLT